MKNFLKLSCLALGGLLARDAAAGTVGLVKDINPDEVVASSSPWFLGVAGDRAIFAGSKPRSPISRLFRTDGTAAGTVEFSVANLGMPRWPLAFGNKLLLVGSPNDSQTRAQAWITDGSDAGTVMLIDLGDVYSQVATLRADANRAWFCAAPVNVSACDLYVTDGTPAGTRKLTTNQSMGVSWLASTGEFYFFSAFADGSQSGLWVSDGTVAGTRMLHAMSSLGFIGLGPVAWVSGRKVFVNADVTNQRGIYSIDLDSGATAKIADNGYSSFAENALEFGGLRYFIMDGSLWRSDGTFAGTSRLSNATLPYSAVNPLVRVGNRLVFSSGDDDHGNEIWVSDGTLAGTQVLVDATPGSEGTAGILAASADRVFFVAGFNAADNTQQFWVSDGTPGNTHVVPQAGGGAYGVYGQFSQASGVVGNHVFMTAEEPDPTTIYQNRRSLWVANLAGTSVTRAGRGGYQLQPLADRVLYSADDDTGGEPWVSDGTPAGTARILDLAISGQTGHSSPSDPVAVGNQAFFVASDTLHGRELWVTDGSAANTRLVRDIGPGQAHGDIEPYALLGVGDLLLFLADDDANQAWLDQLWRSDGTEAGTFRLTDAHMNNICGRWAERWNGRTWFFASQQYYGGSELWSTDGTASGTRMEIALDDDIRNGRLCDLTVTSSGLVFAAVTPSQETQLWRTDGTPAGTIRLGTFAPAEPNAYTGGSWFTAVNGMAYFMGDENPGSGRELWRTDGSATGTTLVTDLTPGPTGALGFGLTKFGDGVVLAYESMNPAASGIYRVAGSSAGAQLIVNGSVTHVLPKSTGSKVFFEKIEAATGSLWVTDGSSAGTHSVLTADVGESLAIDAYAGASDGFLFFHGRLNDNGAQIWVTNGETGVHSLSNFTAPYDAISYTLPLFRNRPLFVHDDLATGSEPWIMTNQPPVAVADAASLLRDSTSLIAFRANDTDVDSSSSLVTEAITTQPAHGTLARESAGWRYTPAAGYVGSDFFEYQLSDELDAKSAVTRVTITVSAPPPPPETTPPKKPKGGGGRIDALWLALLAVLSGLRRRRIA